MTTAFRTLLLASAVAGASAQAAGPLYLHDSDPPRPLVWDTTQGPIPVWTDGGGAFTYDFDGVTPFITIERANEITQFAFDQWNAVPTATLEAKIAGTIEQQIGIADVVGGNAAELYEQQNGYGFWVLYDTDGSILEEYFGVPRYAVLGIAFPEWADEEGHITEATALLNGWYVDASDTEGYNVAGVFTHEFGHAINLAHSQVNGPLVYSSYPFDGFRRYPGVPGCVDPVYAWNWYDESVSRADVAMIETMYPFIDTFSFAGREQSTITHPDDFAAVSNLYPTPAYLTGRGSISGVLRLKDGRTEYSGINVIARNVANPLHDAVSAMTGDQTQGRLGPDGRFTIRNLTPGQEYLVYIEEIVAGGYPTTPQMLVSQGEYWNVGESSDPALDRPCSATPILAEAGVTKTADITFNGYAQGVQFTPIVNAYLTDLAKNGRSAAGLFEQTVFTWNQSQGFEVMPPEIVANNSSMTRNGQWLTVNVDFDGNGVTQAALLSSNGAVISLGDLNGDTCGGSSSTGVASSYGWAVDDSGRTAVGIAYVDQDGDGSCESPGRGEVLPFIWTAAKGMRALDTSSLPMDELPWVRAHAVSGNGEVVLGTSNFQYAFAWVKDGPVINLTERYGADASAYAVSYDGHRVALNLFDDETYQSLGVALWDHARGLTPIGALAWCKDVPYVSWFGGDLCESMTGAEIEAIVGKPSMEIFDMNDDGSVLIGRSGSFFTGLVGALWIEQVGWMTWDEFFRRQGVVEASNVQFSNPISISGSGREVVGGTVGTSFSWLVNMSQVFVCERGNSVQTGFPNGLRAKIEEGAKFGRCEHLED
ncbi:MAG TPA: matrixin family metalloprotease [Steroidobacteraceae bacterium]|nr:matrixin family metalloprotease [Steroidobacteraceae bacterium]